MENSHSHLQMENPQSQAILPDHLMHKNRLYEYSQKLALPRPVYETTTRGYLHAPEFRSTVLVDGRKYTSDQTFSTKKKAEQEVARYALDCIKKTMKVEAISLIYQDPLCCKSILHEFAIKMHLESAKYTTTEGPNSGVVSSLVFNGKTYTSEEVASKKLAEQLAARTAILSLLCNGEASDSRQRKLCASSHAKKDSTLEEGSSRLPADILEKHHEKPRQVPVIEEPNLQEVVILSDDSEGEVEKKSQRCKMHDKAAIKSVDVKKQECGTQEERGNIVIGIAHHKVSNGHISKMDKCKMPADLTDFPNLTAVLAIEAKNRNANIEQYDMEPYHQKPKQLAATVEPNLQELLVLPASNSNRSMKNGHSSETKGLETTELREGKNMQKSRKEEEKCDNIGVPSADHKVSSGHTSKADEYKTLLNLTNSPNLATMQAFETTWRKNRMKKGRIGFNVPINMVNTLGEDKLAYSSKERIPLRTEPFNIMDEIVPRKLLCRPRYFDHPESSRGMAEDDPASVSHTLKKRKQLCRLCGNFNHHPTHCKQVIYCSVCYRRGHVSNDCPEKHAAKDKSSEICLRCGDSGHDLFSCSSDYSSDDLKEIQCFVCNAFGHLCCVDYKFPQGQVSCYKCGQSGHLGSANTCFIHIHEEGEKEKEEKN